MASYKSHFSPPTRPDARAPSTQRVPSSSRLPTRSVTPTLQSQIRPPLPPSKLQKKKVSREDALQPSRALGNNQRPSIAGSTKDKPRQSSSRPAPQVSKANASMTVPRYAAQTSSSSARLPRYEGAVNTRTPSLVSGSSASTIESPRSVLRRKPSSIGRQAPIARPESMSSQEELPVLNTVVGGYNDPFTETVLGITLPPSAATLAAKELEKDLLVESNSIDYRAVPRMTPDDLQPPTPLYAQSSTPSTRYTGSPTSLSHISTPTSMSSYSPGAVSSHKPPQRSRQMSPSQNKPPVSRRRFDELSEGCEGRALSSVRESTTSSSSASTVRMLETVKQREMSKAPMPAPPPSLPPSTSSAPKPEHLTRSPPPVPPEFAHLAEPPQEKPPMKRPVRPSREGTPDISGLRQQSPIIQSNMTSLPSHHRRQSSTGSRLGMSGALQNGSTSRLVMPSKIPSRNPSPSLNYPSAFPPRTASRGPSSRGPTPDMASDNEKNAKGKSLTAPSPTTKSSSRFGFFRRKTEPIPQTTKPEKRLRKGPAAGTGHEGYGKFAGRGRSGSTTSGTASVGRSPSADSIGASLERTPSSRKSSIGSQVDDYFLDRLQPVVIRGTGSSTELCRSPEQLASTTSLDSTLSRATPDPRQKLSESSVKVDAVRPALLPSAMPNSARTESPIKRFGLGIRRGSESEDEKKPSFLPSLASRRSARRSQLFGSKDLGKSPTPINVTSGNTSTDKLGTCLSRQMSGPQQSGKVPVSTEEASGNSKKTPQLKPARKWNFFQRAQASSPKKSTFAERQESNIKPPMSRSVAHYAMDSTNGQHDMNELEMIMKEAEVLPKEPVRKQPTAPLAPAPQISPVVEQRPLMPKNRPAPEHVQSVLLPSPPMLPPSFPQSTRPASPQVTLRKEHKYSSSASRPVLPELQFSPEPRFGFPIQAPPSVPVSEAPIFSTEPEAAPAPVAELTQSPIASAIPAEAPSTASSSRPSRLAQVGRIPQVVSQRDRERRLPANSFSRPFAPSQPRPTSHMPRASVESIQAPLIAESTIISEAYPAYSGLSTPFNQTTFGIRDSNEDPSRNNDEFLAFPPRRKDSEMSSNSSGFWSVQAPTAIIPLPNAPPGEDEVWNEYDDLIDDVLSPDKEETEFSFDCDSDDEVQERSSGPVVPAPLNTKAMHSASNSVSSNVSVHLRRSRLLSALHAASPNSTLSISDFLAAYGDRHPSVVDSVTGRLSLPSTHRTSSGSGPAKSIRVSLPVSLADEKRQSRSTIASEYDNRTSNKYGDSKLMEIAEQSDNGASMADLRFGALMTSKWLSFGRVLFSPVHFELKDPAEDRILVIDGLGKDWSYYCALTYSEASVYNLGPSPDNASSSAPWSSLPNHRHIHHPTMAAPFPFPRGFFAAVVFRFPFATSENLYRFAISECKRVLRPGGYLELSVLDIELLNMGNRARRAVRGLKVQMQVAEPGVCLKPASDLVMKLLGRKGFENVNRCLVGVPVAAGRLGSWSSDSSAEELTNLANGIASAKSSIPTSQRGKGKAKDKGKEKGKQTLLNPPHPSFTDLLTTPPSPDPAVNATADANITDMVARVGRWWYTKCYESIVIPESNGAEDQSKASIWADGKLLRECEKRGTGFRLLVAYAQKPNCTVRRTVSV